MQKRKLGSEGRRYLEENAGAAALSLDASLMEQLDAALAPEKVAGQRYNERMMALIER